MKNRRLVWSGLLLVLTLLGISACASPSDGLVVVSSAPIATAAGSSSNPPEASFEMPVPVNAVSIAEVREVLTQRSAVRHLPADVADQVLDAARTCIYCVMLTGSTIVHNEIYQLVQMATAADGMGYAVFALRYPLGGKGKAEVALALSGTGISLTPGVDGTLVVQEAIYLLNDAMCCASGQSVTVYRYDGKQFVAGEKFSKLNGNKQETGQ